MANNQVREFYFGSKGKFTSSGKIIPHECGDLICSMNCLEWSDGRLSCALEKEWEDYEKLKEAYRQNTEEVDNKSHVFSLIKIIQAYNDVFHRYPHLKKEVPAEDYAFFVQCVIEVQKRGRDILPLSYKAELYREAGMFAECLGFAAENIQDRDEKEIIDEILFLAMKGECRPFIIEECEYYQGNIRKKRRFSCSIQHC